MYQSLVESRHRHKQKIINTIRTAKDVPCADCGVRYPPYVMDFDHRGDKLFNIGSGSKNRGYRQVVAEIAKCDVVCANCHRERTFNTGL